MTTTQHIDVERYMHALDKFKQGVTKNDLSQLEISLIKQNTRYRMTISNISVLENGIVVLHVYQTDKIDQTKKPHTDWFYKPNGSGKFEYLRHFNISKVNGENNLTKRLLLYDNLKIVYVVEIDKKQSNLYVIVYNSDGKNFKRRTPLLINSNVHDVIYINNNEFFTLNRKEGTTGANLYHNKFNETYDDLIITDMNFYLTEVEKYNYQFYFNKLTLHISKCQRIIEKKVFLAGKNVNSKFKLEWKITKYQVLLKENKLHRFKEATPPVKIVTQLNQQTLSDWTTKEGSECLHVQIFPIFIPDENIFLFSTTLSMYRDASLKNLISTVYGLTNRNYNDKEFYWLAIDLAKNKNWFFFNAIEKQLQAPKRHTVDKIVYSNNMLLSPRYDSADYVVIEITRVIEEIKKNRNSIVTESTENNKRFIISTEYLDLNPLVLGPPATDMICENLSFNFGDNKIPEQYITIAAAQPFNEILLLRKSESNSETLIQLTVTDGTVNRINPPTKVIGEQRLKDFDTRCLVNNMCLLAKAENPSVDVCMEYENSMPTIYVNDKYFQIEERFLNLKTGDIYPSVVFTSFPRIYLGVTIKSGLFENNIQITEIIIGSSVTRSTLYHTIVHDIMQVKNNMDIFSVTKRYLFMGTTSKTFILDTSMKRKMIDIDIKRYRRGHENEQFSEADCKEYTIRHVINLDKNRKNTHLDMIVKYSILQDSMLVVAPVFYLGHENGFHGLRSGGFGGEKTNIWGLLDVEHNKMMFIDFYQLIDYIQLSRRLGHLTSNFELLDSIHDLYIVSLNNTTSHNTDPQIIVIHMLPIVTSSDKVVHDLLPYEDYKNDDMITFDAKYTRQEYKEYFDIDIPEHPKQIDRETFRLGNSIATVNRSNKFENFKSKFGMGGITSKPSTRIRKIFKVVEKSELGEDVAKLLDDLKFDSSTEKDNSEFSLFVQL